MIIKIRSLLVIFLVILAQVSLAEAENKINLLPNGVKDDGILVRESVVKMSNTLKNTLEDVGEISDNMDLPVSHVDKQTLSAIMKSLEAMQELQNSGVKLHFGPIKLLVRNSLVAPVTSLDLINFLLAANFLDIPKLLKPAAANVVDSAVAEEPPTKSFGLDFFENLIWRVSKVISSKESFNETKLKYMLEKHKIPKELHSYLEDYLKFKTDPTSLITQSKRIISVQNSPHALVMFENNLYVANSGSDNISVIDRKTGLEAHAPIPVGSTPKALSIFGNKLYVANYGSNNISVIDLKTNKIIGTPKTVGQRPRALIFYIDKLYVANEGSNNLSVYDSKTDQVIGTIAAGLLPSALGIFENDLYVANMGSDNIFVIDPLKPEEAPAAIALGKGKGPRALSFYGKNLYSANFSADSVSAINAETGEVIGEPIGVGQWPFALSASGDKLFVANYQSNDIFVIDLKSFKAIGSPVPAGPQPSALGIFDNDLYVANKDNQVWVFDLNKFLYYSK